MKFKKISHFLGPVNRDLAPIFLNSMPKAGTNLVEKCLVLRGYRRSFSKTHTEHNTGIGRLSGSPGRFKVGHLFLDDPIHGGAFKTLYVHRRLWPCVRSYVNYMFMDTAHQASSFMREGVARDEAELYLERLILGDDNPLGRSVLFEYRRFYELDITRYDLVLSYEQFRAKDVEAVSSLARLLGMTLEDGAKVMQSALDANTWTKNNGAVDIFKNLSKGFMDELIGKVIEVEKMSNAN